MTTGTTPEKAFRTLVIEDNPQFGDFLRRFLIRRNHDVGVAGNGALGLEQCASSLPEMVVLDIHLPDLTGFEVCRRIRSLPVGRDVFILAVTGDDSEQVLREAISAGVDDFITKPFAPGVLDIRLCLAERSIHQIRETRSAEAKVLYKNEQYRLLTECAFDLVSELDHEGNFVFANSRYREDTGFAPEELIGRSSFEFIHPDDRPTVGEQFRLGVSSLEFRHLRRDGTSFWAEVRANRFTGPSGKPHTVVNLRDVTQRREADLALLENTQQMLAVFENTWEGILVLGDSRQILAANRAAAKLFGSDVDRILDYEIDRFFTREYPFEHLWKQLQERRELTLTDLLLQTIAGEFRIAEVNCRWEFLPGRHLLILRDVTERKQAEKALLSAETRFRRLVEGSPVGIYIGQDKRLLYANPRLAEMYGYTVEELMAVPDLDTLVAESSRQLIHQKITARVSGAVDHVRYSIVGIRKDGSRFDAEIAGARIDLEGTPAIIGSVIDVTDRNRAEREIRSLNETLEGRVTVRTAQLRESEEKLRLLLEGVKDYAILLLSPDGCILSWNHGATDLTGFAPGEMLGRSISCLNTPEDAAAGTHAKILLAAQEVSYFEAEEWRVRKDGTRFRAEINVSPIRDAKDLLRGYSMVLRDVTVRKRAEESLRQALETERELNRLKTSFVSMVSHEFRTPLGIILSSQDILRNYDGQIDPAKRRQHLERIENCVRHMTNLLEQVLFLGRADAGRLAFRPVAAELEPFCRLLLDDVRVLHQRSGPLELRFPKGLGVANVDEDLLRHILLNLVMNAVKYSPVDEPVFLDVSRQQDDLVFQVIDRGVGIPEEDQKHLFSAFYRGANVGNISGTGLGLVIVKRCVERHGGSIAFESNPGKGTVFTVRLPFATDDAPRPM